MTAVIDFQTFFIPEYSLEIWIGDILIQIV